MKVKKIPGPIDDDGSSMKATSPAKPRLALNSPGVYDIGILQPFLHGLPADQQTGGGLLIFNLLQVSKLVDAFAASVALLDHVETLESDVEAAHPGPVKPIELGRSLLLLDQWSDMAGRDAVLTVYHFEKTIAAIRNVLKDVPAMISQVEHGKLRRGRKALPARLSERGESATCGRPSGRTDQ